MCVRAEVALLYDKGAFWWQQKGMSVTGEWFVGLLFCLVWHKSLCVVGMSVDTQYFVFFLKWILV